MANRRIYFRQDWAKNIDPENLNQNLFVDSQKRIEAPFDELEYMEIFMPLSYRLASHFFEWNKNSERKCLDGSSRVNFLPYIIGVTGSVSVGKTSFCKQLKKALSMFLGYLPIEIVSTDSFLYPNHILSEQGLENKKGFPISYDNNKFSNFLKNLAKGEQLIFFPIYSHRNYDIDPCCCQVITRPVVIILEGVNLFHHVLFSDSKELFRPNTSIYLDAAPASIKSWFVKRILDFNIKSSNDPESYFYRFRTLSKEDMLRLTIKIWDDINWPNLVENILPSRAKADIVFYKQINHRIDYVVV